ncbi:hypothetical protein [Geothrix sp. 21YS21S-4]|uniref:hypothetical protein n=1 Tax=Geothrix sp. 21YS21S-4 TaxID=3068889 RepID=UPI0027BA0890|nr:hypothetical protein [Geothrix sp. 21YS21S-4]
MFAVPSLFAVAGGAAAALAALRLPGLGRDWRAGRIPATRLLLPGVILVEGVGAALAPASRWVLPLKLGTALGLEVLLVGLAFRAWRRAAPGTWPEERLASALEAFLPPRVARLVALEMTTLWGALRFLVGGFRAPAPAGFSLHRQAALGSLLPVLPLLLPGDVLLIRALLSGAPTWLRWTLHLSTAYAVLWLVGLYAAMKERPHQIRGEAVELRVGAGRSLRVRRDQISSATPFPDFEDDWTRRAHLRDLHRLITPGPPIVELRFREPVAGLGLLGPTRARWGAAVSVDEPAAFLAALGHPCA